MLPYDDLMRLDLPAFEITWAERDVMLHAVATGMGRAPAELPYVYERDLHILPNLLNVLEKQSAPDRIARMGIRLAHVLHGAQTVELHAAMPASGRLIGAPRIVEAYDKGDKGAVVLERMDFRDPATEAPVATTFSTMIVRGEGHFGGATGKPPPAPAASDRMPDHQVRIEVRPEQAALFRLLGDFNPLHIDPKAAQAVGFDRPIIHGLCTLGMTAPAVFSAFPDLIGRPITSHGASFASYLLPGETLVVSIWQEEDGIAFTADALERGSPVLRSGLIRFG